MAAARAPMTSSGLDDVRAGLDDVGFTKRAGQIFTRKITDDVVGWLGLNLASRHRPAGEVEVLPVVGVRHQGVERLVAELRGEKFHAYQPPTVNAPLGHLLPGQPYKAWIIDAADTSGVAEDLVKAVEKHGVPFMESCSTLAALRLRLDDRMGFDHQLVYRRPVAALIAGDETRAASLIDEAEAELGDRSDPAAIELRGFIAAFRAHADVSRSS